MSTAGWQDAVALLQEGQAHQAEQILRPLTITDPQSFEAHFYLGVALAQQGRHQDAVGPLTTAANLRPDHAGARYNLAVMLQHTGDVAAAAQQYEAALQLDPSHRKARQALQTLQTQRPAAPARPPSVVPGLSRALDRPPPTADEPYHTEAELKAADRAEMHAQLLVRGSVILAWGIGLAGAFLAFCNVMGPIYGIVIVAPILGPLIYLVGMDGREWFTDNPRLAIPFSIAGLIVSAIALLAVYKHGGLSF